MKGEVVMSWRHVMIANNARLSIKNSQLIIKQDEVFSIPLSDIASIMIEAPAVTITANVLSACAEHKVSLFTCDSKKLPNGIWTGYHQHSRQLMVLETQFALSKPFKKGYGNKLSGEK
ncbi:CRISPR-associated endonuclease Cas1 [Aquibacillus sp. 3ASR75-11]|uniref:CRISPR-associated endonuclease Cas1 n=1 Tax=Terrihalobacillus insolitus TaxID=2950438 RepID=A0A9X3WWQ1_9BACI|nr:CRISPR-associated endonuclease Cas1 [Terrihalobacillus insolitus]MDC3424714.1 CRISPR-associated endonuclease Cas1 [Terrihalobacillus insolitus]